MEKWEQFVDPHFSSVVENLQPSLILDKLRQEGLVSREEYACLWKDKHTEIQRARILVNDLLPRKGKDSLDVFCSILLETRGQEHIVTDIIYKPTSKTRRKGKKPKSATFCFKEEYREAINDKVQSVIRRMCHEFFSIKEKRVKFEFDDNPGKEGYLCYSDLQDKPVVLKVHGVSPDKVRIYEKKLIRCIVGFLNQHKVKRRQVHFQDAHPGCSIIILSMDIDSFIDLLCLLGQEERSGAKELGVELQRAIPCLQKGNLFLGGLPAIELFSEPLERVQPPFSLEQTRNICITLSRKALHLEERVFPMVDLITDELEETKQKVKYLREWKLWPCQISEYETNKTLEVLTTKTAKMKSEQLQVPQEWSSVTEKLQGMKEKQKILLDRVKALSKAVEIIQDKHRKRVMALSNDDIVARLVARLASSHDYDSVESAVLRAGAYQWYQIGQQLRMFHGEITAATHSFPTDAGKLKALINVKRHELGEDQVKWMLLKVCDKIRYGILGVVQDLLECTSEAPGKSINDDPPQGSTDAKIDVLIVTATKTEFRGVKAVLQEVSGQDMLKPCPIDYSGGVLPCKVATWEHRKGHSPLTVGVTRQADIGTDGATNLVVALKDALGKAIAKNGLVAMVGICAGDGSSVALGDVLIPWTIALERGKLSKPGFKVQADPVGLPHQLKTAVITAEKADDEAKWLNYVPAKFRNAPSPMYLFDATLQELQRWKTNDGVANIGDLYKHLMQTYDKWPKDFINKAVIIETLKTLQTSKYVIDVDGKGVNFQISSEGKKRIHYLTDHNDSFPRTDSKPIICHDPVITGGIVHTALEKKAWDELKAHTGQRKAVGYEMEGHTFLSQMAIWCQTTRSILIKAVADLGTNEYKMKEKYYQVYATAVAAAFLFHFLKVVDPSKWQTSTT